jgi:alpha-mannosidase
MPVLTAHVVAHTHWDREWYQPLVRFRQRLVTLIDELLDDPPAPDESFLLDGQAIVIDDYLDVRPEREAELTSLLRSGQLEAGPWYVLADELIPSAEAIVRNLLLGRRVLRRFGASSPPVLYCPDSFGHPAALPTIATGFGLPLIVLWRGFGSRRWPQSDTVLWRAPDRQRLAVYHFPRDGYEYGSDLPLDARAARDRWSRMRETYVERAATGEALVPNGADHHARQRGHREAVASLAAAARETGDLVKPSSLGGFAAELLASVRDRKLPEIEGELRDSYGFTWTLQGTFGTRAAQKRGNARAERALIRDAEPWAALARLRGGKSRLPLLVTGWRTLLQAHPHDTLCGCSIDAVADAMDRRLDDALLQAVGIRDDAVGELLGYDAEISRTAKASWTPILVVRNRAARPRSGVALVEVKQFMADVAVGPGSAPSGKAATSLPNLPSLGNDVSMQVLERRTAYDRLESPRHYPDNDLVAVSRAAIWIDDVPGYGLTSLPLGGGAQPARAPQRSVRGAEDRLDNGLVKLVVSNAGRVSITDVASGRQIDDILVIDDRVDVGDLYTPAVRGPSRKAEFIDCSLAHAGPLLGELHLRWRLRRAKGKGPTSELSVRLVVVAESAVVRCHVAGINRHRDHRLRLGMRTNIRSGELWADAAFGPVQRKALRVPEADRRDEIPPATAPLHRYVSIFDARAGATLYSDGLAEYEATKSGKVYVTLLRAVGELSRNDLPERRGHAGWPSPTPKAQSLGRFSARVALLIHGARTAETIDTIERTADDFLVPIEGRTLRSSLSVPPAVLGVELHGAGLAFSTLKEAEDGEWLVARCVNLLDVAVEGEWRFGSAIKNARIARLDESPQGDIPVLDNAVRFVAPPRGPVTILVR